LEIDWQGARQVRAAMPQARSIFVLPPSRAALKERLRGRAQDSDAVIARRLADAVTDMSHWDEFDWIVVNDQFDTALLELHNIVRSQRLSRWAQADALAALLDELLQPPAPT